jgi:hypothetical protein
MGCEHFILPNGAHAIVCGRTRKTKRCACGKPSTRLCDWKIEPRAKLSSVTCDIPLCDDCSYSPAENKDLCRKHAAEWQARIQAAAGHKQEPQS